MALRVIIYRNLLSKWRFCFRNLEIERHLCAAGASGSPPSSITVDRTDRTSAEAPNIDKNRRPILNFLRSLLVDSKVVKIEADKDKLALRGCAMQLYRQCSSVDYFQFTKKFNLKDTFESWFVMTGLHMWFVLLRLRQERDVENGGYDDFRDMFVEILWQDVERRFNLMKLDNEKITKRAIRQETVRCYSLLTSLMMELDEGIMCDDMVLAGAVWRIFYKGQCVDDIIALNSLVRYIRMSVHQLSSRSIRDVITSGVSNWDLPKD